MTEREAFEQAGYSNDWELWQAACKYQREQVKEWKNLSDELMMRLGQVEEELAALKQSQGEPVARITGTKENGHRKWSVKPYDALYKVPSQDEYPWHVSVDVYTAPTIPEGWQLVTTERMKELEEYEFMYKSVSK